jgi:hypothetical protein
MTDVGGDNGGECRSSWSPEVSPVCETGGDVPTTEDECGSCCGDGVRPAKSVIPFRSTPPPKASGDAPGRTDPAVTRGRTARPDRTWMAHRGLAIHRRTKSTIPPRSIRPNRPGHAPRDRTNRRRSQHSTNPLTDRPRSRGRAREHPDHQTFVSVSARPYLPDEPRETSYAQTLFRRLQNVMAAGGFSRCDLG